MPLSKTYSKSFCLSEVFNGLDFDCLPSISLLIKSDFFFSAISTSSDILSSEIPDIFKPSRPLLTTCSATFCSACCTGAVSGVTVVESLLSTASSAAFAPAITTLSAIFLVAFSTGVVSISPINISRFLISD